MRKKKRNFPNPNGKEKLRWGEEDEATYQVNFQKEGSVLRGSYLKNRADKT